jgi:glyoxylate reductase
VVEGAAPSRVFVSRRIPQAGLDLLAGGGARLVVGQENEEEPLPRAALLAGVEGCDVLLPLLTEAIDRDLLARSPGLLGVAQMAVGYDNIDVAAATELGIPVSNTPGVLTETTADLAWALLLAVARSLPQAHAYQAAGRYRLWGPNLFLGADVGVGATGRRKVLGIVGYGRIGRAVAKRAVGFDMDVLAFDPALAPAAIEADGLARAADLATLLARSDFVTLHAPSTAGTRHLIGASELRAMRPGAYLINTARGELVDEAALVVALREGWIAGAGLDVYEHEPALAPGLAGLDNVVLLPHIGSATRETRGRMATMAAENALCHLRGERAPNAVNPEVYDGEPYRRRRART